MSIDYLLTEEQQMIKDLCHQIAEEQIKPVAAQYDESGEFAWDIVKILADSDIFAVPIPEEYGGMGGGVLETSLVTEELSWGCAGIALTFGGTGLGTFPILLFGNEDQKQHYLPPIAKGEKLAAFAITEADAGSDAGRIRTTAVRDGNEYVLNGTKQWITNSVQGNVLLVLVKTDLNVEPRHRGMSLVVAEKHHGYVATKLDKLGYTSPASIATILIEQLPDTDSRILDLGCGTGLTCRLLAEQGYDRLDGIERRRRRYHR